MPASRGRVAALHWTLGASLALSVATWFAAASTFQVAAGLPEAAAAAGAPQLAYPMVTPEGRGLRLARPDEVLIRFQAAETNRLAFRASSRAQLVLAGLGVLLACWPPAASRPVVFAVLATAVLAALLGLVVVPSAESAGLALAFAERPLSGELVETGRRMARLHGAYGVLDLIRVGLLVAAGVGLTRGERG